MKKKTKNLFDMFAIKLCDNVRIVGHFPMDISRPTKYLLDRVAVFTVELTSTNYPRSPLIQRGFKIPAKDTVTMPGTVKNHLMEKHKEIVNVTLNQGMKRFYVHFWLYHQLEKHARETRDLKKA